MFYIFFSEDNWLVLYNVYLFLKQTYFKVNSLITVRRLLSFSTGFKYYTEKLAAPVPCWTHHWLCKKQKTPVGFTWRRNQYKWTTISVYDADEWFKINSTDMLWRNEEVWDHRAHTWTRLFWLVTARTVQNDDTTKEMTPNAQWTDGRI